MSGTHLPLVDTYGRLYRDETGYLALRFSTLFQPYHRQWLSQSLEAFMRRMIEADAAFHSAVYAASGNPLIAPYHFGGY